MIAFKRMRIGRLVNKMLILLIGLILILNGCANLLNPKNDLTTQENKTISSSYASNTRYNFSGVITREFLKEAIPDHNSEKEERVNIIFDCRNMNKEEFDSCVNYLWRFLNDEPSNIPNISFGLFQIEPFKSSKDKFNVWYIDRNLMDPKFAFNTKNQSCDITDRTFTYDKNLHNIILVYVCKDSNFGRSTLFPIMEKTPETLTKEKEMGVSIFNLGNIKSVVSMGLNEKAMEEMSTEPSALGLSLVLTHEMGHAIGGLGDEYTSESVDKLKSEIEGENDTQAQPKDFKVSGGFPNCAPTKEIADKWWKKTGLVSSNISYVGGCNQRYYLIPYKYTMMSKRFDKPGGITSDELFTSVHRYWICRNIYNMTGSSSGVCSDIQNKYGFDQLLYSEEEK